ncbi:MAG: DUF1848 family protein [bacterium]
MVIDGPRMSDVSEEEESRCLAQFVETCSQGARPILGVHLWTHSPTRFLSNPVLTELLSRLAQSRVPVALQVTVTGLGGTPVEPGIEPTSKAFAAMDRLLRSCRIPAERVCLRIDPLQAWEGPDSRLTNVDQIDTLLDLAGQRGLSRVRVSLIAYPRYASKIRPRLAARGLRMLPLSAAEIGRRLRTGISRGIDIRTCATDLVTHGIPAGSCFDFEWVTGRPLEAKARPVAARKGCLCVCPESVLLWKVPRRSSCAGRCLACYAQEHI